MLFRLQTGVHYDRGGKKYTAGDVVESDCDLTQAFKNKFVRDHAAETASHDPFGGERPAAAPAKKTAKQPAAAPAKKTAKATTGAVRSKLGEDVTEGFPEFKNEGLIVLKSGTWYHVAERTKPNDGLNDGALRQSELDGWLTEYASEG